MKYCCCQAHILGTAVFNQAGRGQCCRDTADTIGKISSTRLIGIALSRLLLREQQWWSMPLERVDLVRCLSR